MTVALKIAGFVLLGIFVLIVIVLSIAGVRSKLSRKKILEWVTRLQWLLYAALALIITGNVLEK